MRQILQKTIDSVANIIDTLTKSNELFTAYDITSILRGQNLSDGLTHWEIKEIVHDYYLTGNMADNYVRTNTFFNGNAALLYLPDDKTVSDYDSSKVLFDKLKTSFGLKNLTTALSNLGVHSSQVTINQNPVFAKSASLTHNLTTVVNVVKKDPDTVVADKRGRITVPKKYVSTVSDNGWVNVDKRKGINKITLYKSYVWSDDAYSVDRYGNIKISLGKNKAGSVCKFQVVNSKEVLVTVA